MNTVNLIGNLCNEWEFVTTNNGKMYGKNTLAIRKDKENTLFIPIRVWAGAVELVDKYTKKGDKLGVNGRLDVYNFKSEGSEKNSYYTYVNVQDITFCERK